MDLRTVTISEHKAANAGSAYTDRFLGLEAVEVAHGGVIFQGEVTAVDSLGYATITAPDGRWLRSASRNLRVVVDGLNAPVPVATCAAGHRHASISMAVVCGAQAWRDAQASV